MVTIILIQCRGKRRRQALLDDPLALAVGSAADIHPSKVRPVPGRAQEFSCARKTVVKPVLDKGPVLSLSYGTHGTICENCIIGGNGTVNDDVFRVVQPVALIPIFEPQLARALSWHEQISTGPSPEHRPFDGPYEHGVGDDTSSLHARPVKVLSGARDSWAARSAVEPVVPVPDGRLARELDRRLTELGGVDAALAALPSLMKSPGTLSGFAPATAVCCMLWEFSSRVETYTVKYSYIPTAGNNDLTLERARVLCRAVFDTGRRLLVCYKFKLCVWDPRVRGC